MNIKLKLNPLAVAVDSLAIRIALLNCDKWDYGYIAVKGLSFKFHIKDIINNEKTLY